MLKSSVINHSTLEFRDFSIKAHGSLKFFYRSILNADDRVFCIMYISICSAMLRRAPHPPALYTRYPIVARHAWQY